MKRYEQTVLVVLVVLVLLSELLPQQHLACCAQDDEVKGRLAKVNANRTNLRSMIFLKPANKIIHLNVGIKRRTISLTRLSATSTELAEMQTLQEVCGGLTGTNPGASGPKSQCPSHMTAWLLLIDARFPWRQVKSRDVGFMGPRDVGEEEVCRFEAVRQRVGDRT